MSTKNNDADKSNAFLLARLHFLLKKVIVLAW